MKAKFTKTSKAFVLLLSFSFCLLSFVSHAQAPQAFKYQTVVRDANNEIIPNQAITLKISILQTTVTGTAVYVETHSATTNALGIVNLNIGEGTPVIGIFGAISWGTDNYFLKIEIDPAGGTTYQYMGTSQLLSVPYALYAASSGGLPAGTSGQTLRHDGTAWISSGLLLNNGTGLGIGTSPNINYQLYMYRPSSSYGAGLANLYVVRNGVSGAANGGTGWSNSGVDAAIKGYSYYGNNYTAGIAGYSYLDYANSAAVIGSMWDATTFGALAYKDAASATWAGYFKGNVFVENRLGIGTSTSSKKLEISGGNSESVMRISWGSAYPLLLADIGYPASGGFKINAKAGGGTWARIEFLTEDVERMRITHDGNVGIGTTTPSTSLYIKQQPFTAFDTPGAAGISLENHINTSPWTIYNSNLYLSFAINNVRVGYINNVTGAYTSTSDARLKADITSMENVLDRVMKLRPVRYRFIDRENSNTIGFIAQDVLKLFPEVVSKDDESEESYYGIAYGNLSIISLKAIQEQQDMIEKLQQIVEQQQRQIDELRNQITK